MKFLAHLRRTARRLERLGLARDEISEELQFHLAMEAERMERSGISRVDAERLALESFGDLPAIEKECRQIRGGKLEDATFEIRSAAATLASDRRATSTAFGGLTIALVFLALSFSATDSALFKQLPYRDADRIVRLWSTVPGIGPGMRWGIAKAQFQFFQRESRSFSHMGLYRYETVTARANRELRSSQVSAMATSEGTLAALGVRPLLGRGFSSSDNLGDTPRVALLTYPAWETLYNRSLAVVGNTLEVNGSSVRIVGVLPQGVEFPEEIEEAGFSAPAILLPLRLNPSDPQQNNHVYRAIASLRPGVEHAAAMQELRHLVAQLPTEMPSAYPRSFMNITRFGVELVPLTVETQGGPVFLFVLMLVSAALLLTLACAAAWNTPARVAGQRLAPFSTEMVILVAGAAAVALVLASIATRISPQLPQASVLGQDLNARTVFFTLLTAGIAGVFLAAFRNSTDDHRPERKYAPVLVQAAITLSLAVLAVGIVRDLDRLDSTYPGFEPDGAVATRIQLPSVRYASHDAVAAFDSILTERLQSIDGVEAVGFTSSLPLSGFDGCTGVTADDRRQSRCVPVYFVTPGYLSALGVPIKGREAAAEDEAVVSASFARRTWPGVDPAGRTISVGSSTGSYRVVGVAGNVRSRGLDRDPVEDVFVPMTPVNGTSGWPLITDKAVVVRSSHADQRVVRRIVLDAIQAIDPTVEPGPTRSMSAIVEDSTAHRSLPVAFISVTALAALLLCVISAQLMIGRARPRFRSPVQPVSALR